MTGPLRTSPLANLMTHWLLGRLIKNGITKEGAPPVTMAAGEKMRGERREERRGMVETRAPVSWYAWSLVF